MAENSSDTQPLSAKIEAKRLLRLARTGALATIDRDSGGALATLVGVASDWDGAPLFLMSELARHTRNLANEARASLLLTTQGGRGDPLNQPRLTISGPVVLHADPGSRERYLRRNPKAKLYASFADFSVRRMRVEAIHFNGGFGRADEISVADLLAPSGDISQLVDAHARLLKQVDQLGADRISGLVMGQSSGRQVWRAVGLDVEGLDLVAGGSVGRVDFSEPAFDPETWWMRLEERIEQSSDPAMAAGVKRK